MLLYATRETFLWDRQSIFIKRWKSEKVYPAFYTEKPNKEEDREEDSAKEHA